MTFKGIDMTIDAYVEEVKLKNDRDVQQAWLNGLYIRLAVASVLSKDAKYPDSPIENKYVEERELTEEEQIKYAKMMFAQFEVEKANFDSSRKSEVGA